MAAVTPPPGIRLVALDIDDTLIPVRGTLAGETVDAVRAAREAGVEVVLATGRGVGDVAHLSHELGIDEFWALCSNGSVTARIVRGEFTIERRVTFDPRALVTDLRRLEPGAPIAIESSGLGFLIDGVPFEGQAGHVIGEIGDLPAEVTFLSIGSATLGVDALVGLSVGHPVRAVPYFHDGWVTVDIVHADAGKGAALAWLAASLGVPASECIAVGDYLNDIPMLAWAGWSAAMGQAPPEVRAAADAVVASSADHGAAQVLRAVVAARS